MVDAKVADGTNDIQLKPWNQFTKDQLMSCMIEQDGQAVSKNQKKDEENVILHKKMYGMI
jgi:hypothetical protein